MDLIKNWKLHLLAVLIVCVAEWIGMQKFGLVVLLPLLYALVLGGIVSWPRLGILNAAQMERASHFMPIAMLMLIAKIGLDIGPNLSMLLNSGLALIMQEFGHFFGTLIFGLPRRPLGVGARGRRRATRLVPPARPRDGRGHRFGEHDGRRHGLDHRGLSA